MAHTNNPHWADFDDVVGRWAGAGAPTDEALVDELIHDAEHVILAEYPRIQERIDAGTLDLSIVKFVVTRMVSRVLRNPDVVTYWQQNTGPFGQARNFGENVDIWLTDNEKQLLAPNRRGKAFEVDLGTNAVSPPADFAWRDVTAPVWRRLGE